MPHIPAPLAGVVFVAAMALLQGGCDYGRDPNDPPPIVTDRFKGRVSRKQIRRGLERLAKSNPPVKARSGYLISEDLPETIDYVCSECGEKTAYPPLSKPGDWERKREGNRLYWIVFRELPGCRRVLKDLRGLYVGLDSTDLCRKCRPDLASPQLTLVVRYPDQPAPHRFPGVTHDDTIKIREFLMGSVLHYTPTNKESALKDHIPRLRELLAVNP
jgi:hypothetical protein